MRRSLFGVVLTGILAAACEKGNGGGRPGLQVVGNGTDAELLAVKAAESLVRIFRAVGLEPTQHDSSVAVSGKTINVAARVNNKLERNGAQILDAQFDISVDGIRVPELTGAVVGIDPTPAGALETAAEDWAMTYGLPIGLSIAARLGARGGPASSKIEIDGVVLFHGPVGLRGEAKTPAAASSNEFLHNLAATALTSMRARDHSGPYRSATIQLAVDGTVVVSGECRADGIVAPELCKALSKLSWPEAAPTYVYKLFFVLPVP